MGEAHNFLFPLEKQQGYNIWDIERSKYTPIIFDKPNIHQ